MFVLFARLPRLIKNHLPQFVQAYAPEAKRATAYPNSYERLPNRIRTSRSIVLHEQSTSNPEKYTIGWICALSTELVAAKAFLDEDHGAPEFVSPHDDNHYALGKIGKHNVVMAVLPSGEYGTASAASVAKDMVHSFPKVRLGLMVGVGGGAPSKKHDIRLGDVVVSNPGNENGGVYQYDFGKAIQDRSFQTTGVLNQPPKVLRAAVNGLKTQYELNGHRLEKAIDDVLDKLPRLRKKYKRPGIDTDRLYQSGIVHPQNNDASCAIVCGNEPSALVSRSERTEEEDNPAIHYGIIASANQLMKDALVRDKLSAEKDVLCFEMEAAGLMNSFPCLVIRGICDYSDSHKNKEWQGYAAMTAAAYAKDLLQTIVPNRVEAEKSLGEILSSGMAGLQEVAETHRDIAQKQLEAQQYTIKQSLSNKQQECLQLFRLTTSGSDVTYEWSKDRVENRVEGTCMWFLEHDHFQEWLEQDSGPLFVSADPGCGKSVLAKYLIDHFLPEKFLPGSVTICYFFFKDQDQNTVCQALCALLHQLFSQKPDLIRYAMRRFETEGPGLINSTRSLWTILGQVMQDPQTGPVITILDALDECDEAEFSGLMQNLAERFRSNQSSNSKWKCLLTSRPYAQIVSKFRVLLDAFPRIHIPGEEHSETISREVNRVIEHKVDLLSTEKDLSGQVKNHLADQLLRITHRTYLWVYLVFDNLRSEDFKKTPKGVESTIATLPRNINEAYERILSKSKADEVARKALSIILAADRPLTLSEMNVAVNMESSLRSFNDLDLEDEPHFQSRLRSWCGLFVSIYHGKVYLLHQTAREFLLANLPSSTTTTPELRWQHSITIQDAHKVLAKLCMYYLNLFNSSATFSIEATGRDSQHETFLNYSAQFWASHFNAACISNDDDAMASLALNICEPNSKAYSMWFPVFRTPTFYGRIEKNTLSTSLLVVSYLGNYPSVRLLLDKNADLESADQRGRTPLIWAAIQGHETVVKLLLDKGADIEAKDRKGWTALILAVSLGHETLVRLLLDEGADIEPKNWIGKTALISATLLGHETLVRLLLNKGANTESQDRFGETALHTAARLGHETIVRLLLDSGANPDSKDILGLTPLMWAAKETRESVVKLLLNSGADTTDFVVGEYLKEYDIAFVMDLARRLKVRENS